MESPDLQLLADMSEPTPALIPPPVGAPEPFEAPYTSQIGTLPPGSQAGSNMLFLAIALLVVFFVGEM